MNKSVLYQPQRQSILGTLFILLQSVWKFFRIFWAVLLLYVFKGNFSDFFQGYWLWGSILLAIYFIVNAIFSWRNFYFYIKDNQLVLEQGYLKKWKTAIPFDKIVAVNIKQGIMHQVLDVVQLEIDSAGSITKEIKIDAISKELAELLRKELETAYKLEQVADAEQKESEDILHLDIPDLLRVGIAQNHIKAIFLFWIFGYNIYQDLQNVFDKELEEIGSKATSYLDSSDTYFQLLFVAIILLLGIIFSIVRVVLRYYNLTVKQQEKTFSLQQGLLNQKQITVPFSKVQVIKNSINPIQQWLGIGKVQIVQINSTVVQSDKEKVIIEGCSPQKYLRFCNTVFNNPFEADFEVIRPHKRFTRRNFNIFCGLFAMPIGFGACFNAYFLALIPVAVLLAFAMAKLLTYRRSYAIGTDNLYVNGGMVAKTQSITKIKHIQGVKLSQTFFQRRAGVASLKLYIAGDMLSINYIDKATAIAIKDNILYRCQKSKSI